MNILITGAGSPTTWGTCQSLPGHNLIGTDIREVSYPWLQKCYQVPRPDSPDFLSAMLGICMGERIDVVLPQVEDELPLWSMHKEAFRDAGVRVCVCDWRRWQNLDKFSILEFCRQGKIDCVGRFQGVKDVSEFHPVLWSFGLPLVVKSLSESGGRGTRIVKHIGWDDCFGSKPGPEISLDDFTRVLYQRPSAFVVTEYYPGTEYTVDCLCNKGEMLACIPRRRDVVRSGITFEGETVEHKEIIEYCRRIVEGLKLEYIIGFQFKEDKDGRPRLLECNPRVQGTTILSTLAGANIIEGAVQLAKYNKAEKLTPRWGVKMRRYWGCSVS